ncbi:MAG: hypothetical protein LBP26_00705 [Clostridiales bacterium]|nr:hypothetical protein [Clostridiales bacterium]
MESEKELKDALVKRALGYTATDEVEEYAVQDGALTLVKKKVAQKDVAPELAAIKLLMEKTAPPERDLTEEEYLAERERLLTELKLAGKKKRKR